MLPLDDAGVELVAESLSMVMRQSTLRRLHEVVSARADLRLERSTYPLLNQILALQAGRLSDVAAGMGVAVPTASRQVKQLEQLGLVRRTTDPIDGRAILLEVTDAGLEALQRIRVEWRRVLAEVLERWPDKDREILGELLDRLASDLLDLRP